MLTSSMQACLASWSGRTPCGASVDSGEHLLGLCALRAQHLGGALGEAGPCFLHRPASTLHACPGRSAMQDTRTVLHRHAS